MLKNLFLLCFALVASSSSFASVFVGGGAGVTDGAILEAGYKSNPFLSFRGRVGYMPSVNLQVISGAFEEGSGADGFSNFNKFDFNSTTFDIGLEITPLPMVPVLRGIKLIGAYQYMNAGIDASTSYNNATVTFNGVTTNNVNGGVDLRIQNKHKFAPYIAIGWDIINLPVVSARITAGGTFRTFEARIVKLNGDTQSLVAPEDINAELAKVSAKLNDKTFVPSVSLTVRITAPSIPFISFL